MTHQLEVQGDSLGAHPPHERLLVAQQAQERRGAPSAADDGAASRGPQGTGREQPRGRRLFQLRQGRCWAAGGARAIVGRREVEELQGARRSGEMALDQAAAGYVSSEQLYCRALQRQALAGSDGIM